MAGKTLLVTGGTGSFGNAVVRRLLKSDVAEIRIFSRDEKKQEDMRHELGDERLRFYIGDVREYRGVFDVMRSVNYIFHAAALKQVPSCEFHPLEAVRTNVLGTENVLDAAIAAGAERMIALSTDKAVYPVNAMGMSKALMEKLVVAKSRNLQAGQTVLAATRYGNVMASRGSVIPLFARQISEGRDLTVTDPSMTRFLMSLDESVELVLHAFAEANQGDIFVQKSPASTIRDLASAMIRVFDSRAGVRVIGTRHGEKLFESLVSREEMTRAIDHDRFFRIPADARDLNYAKFFTVGEAEISVTEDYTSHNTERLDVDRVTALLSDLPYIKTLMANGQPSGGW